jgi:predicted nucleic acid-binding Zn ribbon protein
MTDDVTGPAPGAAAAAPPAAAGPAGESQSVETQAAGVQGQSAGPVPRPAVDYAARAQLAREALLSAKADAAARGSRPAPAGAHSPAQAPGRRQRRDDPQRLTTAISGLIDEQGWRLAAAAGSMFGRWDQIVGPELAAHTKPEGFADGELTITADSTAWATQVRLLAGTLVRRLNVELGDGAVQRVNVRGPATQRRPGQWRTRDSRGPRDTYG